MRALSAVALSVGLIGAVYSASAQAPVVAPAPNPTPAPAAAAPPRTAPTGRCFTATRSTPGTQRLCQPRNDDARLLRRRRQLQERRHGGLCPEQPVRMGHRTDRSSWNLTYNASYPIDMAVDTRASGAATATAIGTAEVSIPLKPSVALFKDFMEGESSRSKRPAALTCST